MFHKGHKEFLKFVLSQGDNIIIGITSDKYVENNKTQHEVESFEIRKKAVEDFLKQETNGENIQLVPIDHLFGPSSDPNLKAEAIVVTEESKKGADFINKKRKERGLPPLKIVVFTMFSTEHGVISSSLIRKGIINREGRPYENSKWLNHILYLPQELRGELKKPMGKVIKEVPNVDPSATITVGDIVTQTHNQEDFGQKVSVVDLLVKREKVFGSLDEHNFPKEIIVLKAENPAGSLTPQLFKAIKKAFGLKKRAVIQVDGEEDLAVLPALIYAPLGFSVLYGQPDIGIVWIEVTESSKEYAYLTISKFRKNL